MDKKGYQLLAHLASIEQPTLGDPQIAKHQADYKYLLEKGYISHRSGALEVVVTRLGFETLESYERNERLFALQEQNTAIQNTLKNIQFFLALLTTVSIVCQVAIFLRP